MLALSRRDMLRRVLRQKDLSRKMLEALDQMDEEDVDDEEDGSAIVDGDGSSVAVTTGSQSLSAGVAEDDITGRGCALRVLCLGFWLSY